MPENYTPIQLGQLISAIWSKYLLLQGGDVATQRQLLEKDKELFQKDKEIQQLKTKLEESKAKNSPAEKYLDYQRLVDSGKLSDFIKSREAILKSSSISREGIKNLSEAIAFGLVDNVTHSHVRVSEKGRDFFKWYLLENIESK